LSLPARILRQSDLNHARTHVANEILGEIVAGKLSAAGWSWDYCSAVTRDCWRTVTDKATPGGVWSFYTLFGLVTLIVAKNPGAAAT